MLAIAGDARSIGAHGQMRSPGFVRQFAAELLATFVAAAMGILVSIVLNSQIQKPDGRPLLPKAPCEVRVSQNPDHTPRGSLEASRILSRFSHRI